MQKYEIVKLIIENFFKVYVNMKYLISMNYIILMNILSHNFRLESITCRKVKLIL
jgi:hypothetical protein